MLEGFQLGPNMPTLIVYVPTAWLAGMFQVVVNVRVTFPVNAWLSQTCWKTGGRGAVDLQVDEASTRR